MDWSKTKTIFIAVFLVLDIFLLTMLFNNYNESQMTVVKEEPIENKLKTYNIKYGELPDDAGEKPIITAKTKTFSKKDLEEYPDQDMKLEREKTVIDSTLTEPVKLGEKKVEGIKAFVQSRVNYGSKYQYSNMNEKKTKAIFYQQHNDKKLFENKSGKLEIKLNSEGDIIGYEQTLLEDIEENSQKEEVLPAFQAIQTLYKNGLIKPNSTISKVELGYYTVVQLTESQVLSPTWYIRIKKGDKVEKLYVNAFDGSIYQEEKDS
ncbi:two-component system regulatory protein YycI [Bacillus xiapuensis]|uniref:two-component system regulatory protein YycI n=1 Tax=Bacillus xiapuensis TaxID=2014075 RepID=UPI0012FD7933|nr:two-component system regulatory protein YycI [Bacillus xiapuensis]